MNIFVCRLREGISMHGIIIIIDACDSLLEAKSHNQSLWRQKLVQVQ